MEPLDCGLRISDCGLRIRIDSTGKRRRVVTPEEMKNRTKAFAVRVIRMVEALPHSSTTNLIGGQLLRAGRSVGANYRAACRARSTADFLSKMGVVEEECDESMYWMEVLVAAKKLDPARSQALYEEAEELVKIVVASINTTRARAQSAIRNPKSEMRRVR
jgi:four helix bundle protein